MIWWERKSTYLTHESGDVNKFLIKLYSSLLVIKKIFGNLAMDSHTGWSCNTPDHFMPLGNQDKLRLGGPICWSIDFTVTLFDHQQQLIISP